jgi:hypothetical protein
MDLLNLGGGRFTSRVLGTPINGRIHESNDDGDEDYSSSSSCATVAQLLAEADDGDDPAELSASSSIAAESIDVLARSDPHDSAEFRDESAEIVAILQSAEKVDYLHSPLGEKVRMIEIHHDLTR